VVRVGGGIRPGGCVTIVYYKQVLSAVAIGLTLAGLLPYLVSILTGATRPHVFSWVTWGVTTLVVFLAQLEGGGGAGAWPIGVSGSITLVIAVLAYLKRADVTITATDWLFFAVAMSSLPLWYLTSDPLWAVIVLTFVDVLGFGPTVRKAWQLPYSESVLFFALFSVRNLVVVMALEHYSLTTVLFPAAIAAACMLLIAMIVYRRALLAE
jgi:hypothetical protein